MYARHGRRSRPGSRSGFCGWPPRQNLRKGAKLIARRPYRPALPDGGVTRQKVLVERGARVGDGPTTDTVLPRECARPASRISRVVAPRANVATTIAAGCGMTKSGELR